MSKGPKLPPITSAKAVQEAKHSGGKYDDRRSVKDVTGLYLNIKHTNSKSWVYRYTLDGKRIPVGLGAYPDISLKAAKTAARDCAELILKGLDPKTERSRRERHAAAEAAKSITFKAYAENEFLPMKREEYKNPDSYRRVKQILDEWVFPKIGHIAIPDIERVHAIEVLKQKVDGKRLIDAFVDLPDRCHIYMTQVLRKAKADGLIDQIPFVWKDDLEFAFFSSSKEKKKQKKSYTRPALNYRKVPQFVDEMLALDKPKGSRPDVQCMLFGLLTQARSNEARLVTWDEIDLKAKVWHMPASRYKSDSAWAIPLSNEAIKIIKAQPSARHKEGRIFSRLDGGPIHDKNLSQMGKMLGYKEDKHPDRVSAPRWVVFNGFRKTFRTWAQAKAFNNEASELAMKHLDTAKLKQVYIDDPDGWAMFDMRKIINDHYQNFVVKGQDIDNVLPFEPSKKRIS